MATLGASYALPAEVVEFRDTIRRIVVERVAPRAAEIDEQAAYPWDLRRLFADHDMLALPFDAEYGGTGTGTLMMNVAIEEVARGCAASALGRSASPSLARVRADSTSGTSASASLALCTSAKICVELTPSFAG